MRRSSTVRPRLSRQAGAVFAAAVVVLGAAGTAHANEDPPTSEDSNSHSNPNPNTYSNPNSYLYSQEDRSTTGDRYAAEDRPVPEDQLAPDDQLATNDQLATDDPYAVEDQPVPGDPYAAEDPYSPKDSRSSRDPHSPKDPYSSKDQAAPGHQPTSHDLEFNPGSASPGTEVTVNTTACGPRGAGTGHASSLGLGDFGMETATHKEVLVGRFTVPHSTAEGEYKISVSCAGGHKSASGHLWVAAGDPDRTNPTSPSGHVRTGVGGGTSAPGTPQIATGAALLAASAVGGTWLLRRRASGTR